MPLANFFRSLNCASSHSSEINKRTRKSTSKKNNKKAHKEDDSQTNLQESVPNFSSFNPDAASHQNAGIIDRKASIWDEGISFWDIGNYKYTLSRCDDGQRLGTELAEMLSERAKLEEEYAKSMKQWAKKWSSWLNKESNERETTLEGWTEMVEVANKTADVHLDMCKSLLNKPVLKIKDWVKLKYERSILKFKQTKEFENEFENAEKSWVILYDKLKKNKKDYYDSIRNTKQSEDYAKQAQSNPKYTLEQREKLEEKAKRNREEEKKARKVYEDTIIEMDLYRPRHIAKMTEVYEKTQNFEQERILFFKQIFYECQHLLQVHNDQRNDEIFEELLQKINAINPEVDLKWWSKHFGIDTKPNWPSFEEYQPS